MKTRKEYINDFYNNLCEEDTRLDTNHGKVEFITTTKFIDKYLKKGDRILEVGAGTGKYSLHYAKLGYKVNSIEYVDHNIEIFKTKITPDMDVTVEQGDAIDLSRFNSNTFDVTLVLGPLYHLYNNIDIDKCIKEAIRVTKVNGIVAFSYLTNDSVIISYGLKKNNLVLKNGITWDENFELVKKEEEIFRTFYISEFKELMNKYNIEYLNNIATDGMSHHLKEKIDSLTPEEYDIWIKYHLSICEREDLQGWSNHMLYICKKNSN